MAFDERDRALLLKMKDDGIPKDQALTMLAKIKMRSQITQKKAAETSFKELSEGGDVMRKESMPTVQRLVSDAQEKQLAPQSPTVSRVMDVSEKAMRPEPEREKTVAEKVFVDPLIGAGKFAGQTALSGAEGFSKYVAEPTAKMFGVDVEAAPSEMKLSESEALKPKGAGQKMGYFGADVASYLLPSMGAAKALGLTNKLGKAATTGQKLSRMGKLAGVEGAVTGGVTALQEGEFNKNVLTDAALGAASIPLMGAAGVIGKRLMRPKATKELIKESKRINTLYETADKMGIPPGQIDYIQKLSPTSKGVAVEMFDNVNKRLVGDPSAANSFEVAGKYFDNFVKDVEKSLKAKGVELGTQKELIKGKMINPRPVKQEVQKLMKGLGVKFGSDGAPDFGTSSIKFSGQAKEVLDSVVNFAKKNSVDAMDMENFTSQIDSLSGLLKQSGLKQGDPGVKAMTDAKKAINRYLGDQFKDFGGANQAYAEVAQELKKIKHGFTVKMADGSSKFSGALGLRRMLGNAPEKQKESLEAVSRLAKKLGLGEDLDFLSLARTADLVEKTSGAVNPQSLAGVTGQGLIDKGLRKAPIIKDVVGFTDFLKDAAAQIKGAKDAATRTQLLSELLDAMPQPQMDAKVMESLAQMPTDKIEKAAILAIGSLMGSQLQGLDQSETEELPEESPQ